MSFFSRAKPGEPNPLAKPYHRKPQTTSHPPAPGSSSSSSRADPSSGVPPPPKGAAPPPPPPRSTLTPQQQRLATLSRLSAQLDALTATVRVPAKLRFAAGSTTQQPKLTFDPINKPAHELDDALTKMLIALDGVESEGDETVRDERKRLVKRVEGEIEKLDAEKAKQYKAQLDAGEIEQAQEMDEHEVPGAEVDADRVGELNGKLPLRGGAPPPPSVGNARIYQHVGPEHGWNDAPPAIIRRGVGEAESAPAPRNKRASMRRPPPTQFY